MAKKNLLNQMQSGLGAMLQPAEPKAAPIEENEDTMAVVEAAVAAAELAQPETSTAGHNAGKTYKRTGKTSTMGLKDGETRYTVILKEETLDKIKELAYLTRRTTRATVEEALAEAIAKYEKANGVIVPFKG